MAPEKRKFSDVSPAQTSLIKKILLACREHFDEVGVDDDDEDVRELNRNINKLTDTKHTAFSAVTPLTLGRMGIEIESLAWRSDGETEARTLGNTTLPRALTIDQTRKNVDDVLKYVSLESEAGCRILINAVLIHVASNLETDVSGVVIVPEFRFEDTVLGCTENSFGGLVDYMLIYGDKAIRNTIIHSKVLAFTDPAIYKFLKCNIYEAKPEELSAPTTYLPQAAMAAIIKAQQLQVKTFRGCVTSGKSWVFFVYNAEDPRPREGKTVHWMDPIPLGERNNPTVNLELILGILRDWVEHGHDKHLRFFEYPM